MFLFACLFEKVIFLIPIVLEIIIHFSLPSLQILLYAPPCSFLSSWTHFALLVVEYIHECVYMHIYEVILSQESDYKKIVFISLV